jgi:tetratricopeptide (TPR) repeat protein
MIRIQNQIFVACMIAFLVGLGACARTPMQKRDRFLESGKKLFEKKQYAKAILDFKNAAAAMPKDAEAYYQLGRAYAGQHEFQTAVNILQQALQLNPNHAGAQLEISKIMASTIDPELLADAESRLNALLQSGGNDPEALNTLAFTELKLGKVETGVAHLQQALAIAPQALNSSILLAKAKLAQRDFNGAEQALRKACEDAPKSLDARVVLGKFYMARSRLSEAEQQYQQALSINPTSPLALLDLARLQIVQGRKPEAEQTLKRLSALSEPSTKAAYAMFLLQEGRKDGAIREFQELAKKDPDDRAARTMLVAAYEFAGRKDEAEGVLKAALKKNPKDLDAILQRGELYLANGKYGLAETDLNQVLHQRPNSAEVHYILSKMHKARGSVLLQRQELAEALRLGPSLSNVRLELSQVLLDAKAAKAALEVLSEAPASQQQTLALFIQRNWALWALGDLNELRKGIDQGLAAVRAPDLLIQDGLLRLRRGDFMGARSSLEEALRINPEDLRALEVLRRSYVGQKQASASVVRVKEYAAQLPRSAAVQDFLGKVLLANGDKEGSRRAFDAAQTADQNFEAAKMSLSQLDYAEGRFDSARERLKAVLASNPQNATARIWLADVEATHGNPQFALNEYRHVVDLDPTHADALNNTAYLLVELSNQPDEALKYAEKAHELEPQNPNYSDTLGWILYRKGLYSMAVKHMEAAATRKENVVWQYHLAMAYAKAGQSARARSTLESALKVNSKVPEAKAAAEVVHTADK